MKKLSESVKAGSAADKLIERLEDAVENWFGDMEIDLNDEEAAFAKETFIENVTNMLFEEDLFDIDLLDNMMDDVKSAVIDKFDSDWQ